MRDEIDAIKSLLRESSDDNWIQLKTDEEKEAYKNARKSGMSHPDAISKAIEKPKVKEAMSKFQVGQMVTDINGDDQFKIVKVFPNLATALKAYPDQAEEVESAFDSYRPLGEQDKMRPWYLIKNRDGAFLNAEAHTFSLSESTLGDLIKEMRVSKPNEDTESKKEFKCKCGYKGKGFKDFGAIVCPECGTYFRRATSKDKNESQLGHFVKGKFVNLTEADVSKQLKKRSDVHFLNMKLSAAQQAGDEDKVKELTKQIEKAKKRKTESIDQSKRMSEAIGVYNFLKEALPGEEEEREEDANKDALADQEAEHALDNEQEGEAKPKDEDNPDPNEVEEEDQVEDSKKYLGNDPAGDHYYIVREQGALKLQDAAGEVLATGKEVGTDDEKEFIKKMAEKYELNVSYETLDQLDWFEQTQAALPQGTPEDAANVGPVGSNPHPPAPEELPQGEATIEEPSKPDLKPLSKESDALVTGAEPLADEEMTIDSGEQEPEVTEPSVQDFTDDEEATEGERASEPKYKERKPQDKGTAMRGKTPNPGAKRNESKQGDSYEKELADLEKAARKRSPGFMDRQFTKDKVALQKKYPQNSITKKVYGDAKESKKDEKDLDHLAKMQDLINKARRIGFKKLPSEEQKTLTAHAKKLGVKVRESGEMDLSEFTAHLNKKGEVKEITIEEDFNVHGHHTKVELDNNLTEILLKKFGLKEGIVPQGNNNDGALVEKKCMRCRKDLKGSKTCAECGYMNEACSGMKNKKKMEDANDSPMFEDNRTFESAVNELVHEVMEGLGDLNEAEDVKSFRMKVAEEINASSKWGYDRKDAGLIKEKAFKKIMRRMKKMKEDKDSKANYDMCPACNGKIAQDGTVCKSCNGEGKVVKGGTLSKEDKDQQFAGQSPDEYLEDGEMNHEDLPTDQNKMLEESKSVYDHKTWEDKRSYKGLVRSMTKDVMEALEGLKETNRGSIMEEIEFAGQYVLEGRPDASYIKKAVMKKVQRKIRRNNAKPVDERASTAQMTPSQKMAYQMIQDSFRKNGSQLEGGAMMSGNHLMVDFSEGGGEITILPNGVCEFMDEMFNAKDAFRAIQNIIGNSPDTFGPTEEKKTKVEESVNVSEWEYNVKEGNIDLYSAEGDFVDSFNLMDLSKHFMEVNNAENAAQFAKADIDNGWVIFRDAEGTELGSDPMDELVTYWVEQREQTKEEPEHQDQQGELVGAAQEAKVVEGLHSKYIK